MNFDQGPYLCIGADPHPELLLQWGLEDSAAGLSEFAKIFIDQLPHQLRIIKPQVSLFESHGSKGFAVLENLLSELRAMGKYVIADAKRSDIGSSMRGYSNAWLSTDSLLQADALTVSPYLGVDSLAGTIEFAKINQKRVFVLVATSNPEAKSIQAEGLSSKILQQLGEYDSVATGVVVGATVNQNEYGISEELARYAFPILAPGFGAQGVSLSQASKIFDAMNEKVIASVSRSVLTGEADKLAQRIEQAMLELS